MKEPDKAKEADTGGEEDLSCCAELREEFRLQKFGLEHPHPRHFVSPQCFKSTVYIIWSGLWAAYHTAMLMLEIYYNKDDGAEYLIYLTNWTYMVLTGVAITDFVITAYVHLKRKDIIDEASVLTTWYMKVHWVSFNTVNTASIIVTLLYYVLLEVSLTHSSINTHLLNSVYVVSSLVFCAKPIRLLHFYQPLVYALMYIIFSVIYHVSGGGAIYSALDWSNTGSAALMSALVLFIGVPVVHTFCFALFTLRVYISSKCCFQYVQDNHFVNKKLQRDVTPRDIEIQDIPPSRPRTKLSTARPGTNRPSTRMSISAI